MISHRLATSDGVGIAYHRWRPTSVADAALPTVVLQHGFAADTISNWVRPGVVDALVAAGRDVVGVDARGHGASDKPHDPDAYGEARMALDLRELFDACGLSTLDLVGYSMGAIISLITASTDTRIRRLVVGGIGAGVTELGGVDTRHMDNMALAAALRADDPSTIANPVARGFRAFAESTGADRLALAAQAERVHRSPIALDRITARSLLIVGDADPLAARPEVLASSIGAGASLHVVTGDHLAAVGAPDFASSIVQFLAGA